MGAAAGRRGLLVTWAVALAASALAAVPATARNGTQPAAPAAPGTNAHDTRHAAGDRDRYTAANLRRDLATVRTAGDAQVNVVARLDRAGRAPLVVRSSAALPRDPQFRVASTTKTFTAVVVLQLVAEKRLRLDDTVEHWLPGVVTGNGNDGSRITVRDLLRHTSGLYEYLADPELQDKLLHHFAENRYDDTPASDLVAVAMRHAPLFTPGVGPRRWAYSNTDYLVAAMIAQKVTGQDWRELVEHRVIAPLGLRHTYVPGANPFLVGPYVPVTIDGPDGRRVDLTEESFEHTADSGVVSTPSDLNTFFRALATGRLLPAAQWRQMRQTVPYDDLPVPPAGHQGGYGLGLRVVPLTCGGVYYMHEGDGFGVYGRPAVSADGQRAVTVSITTTTALIDQNRVNQAVESLTDHALCG